MYKSMKMNPPKYTVIIQASDEVLKRNYPNIQSIILTREYINRYGITVRKCTVPRSDYDRIAKRIKSLDSNLTLDIKVAKADIYYFDNVIISENLNNSAREYIETFIHNLPLDFLMNNLRSQYSDDQIIMSILYCSHYKLIKLKPTPNSDYLIRRILIHLHGIFQQRLKDVIETTTAFAKSNFYEKPCDEFITIYRDVFAL